MAVTVAFASLGWIEVGHSLVLLVFCAGALGYIGYVKQKLAHPTVGVACSLASISLITILTKEGRYAGLGRIRIMGLELMGGAIRRLDTDGAVQGWKDHSGVYYRHYGNHYF